MYRSVCNFRCTCRLKRGNQNIPLKNQSDKRVHIYFYFDENSQTINSTKQPYIQVESLNQKQIFYTFGLNQITKISEMPLTEQYLAFIVEEQNPIPQQFPIPYQSDSFQSNRRQAQSIQISLAYLYFTKCTEQNLVEFISKIKNFMENNSKNYGFYHSLKIQQENTLIAQQKNNNDLIKVSIQSSLPTFNKKDQKVDLKNTEKINRVETMTQQMLLKIEEIYKCEETQSMDLRIISMGYFSEVLSEQTIIDEDKLNQNSKNQLIRNNYINYLQQLPRQIIELILNFIEIKELFEIRQVSKIFNEIFFSQIQSLSFIPKITPSQIVIKMINKIKCLTHLHIGNLQNLKSNTFLENVDILKLKGLQILNFSSYLNLTPKLLITLIQSSNEITNISIPYFIINDDLLKQLPNYLNNIQRIAIQSEDMSYNNNEQIGDLTLSQLITDNKNMRIFEVYRTTPILFDLIQKNEVIKREKYEEQEAKNRFGIADTFIEKCDDVYSRMECFKIFILDITEDDIRTEESLKKISNFKNLKTLELNHVVKKSNSGSYEIYPIQLNTVQTIFKNCKQIQDLCLGPWCSNLILERISQNIESLIKIKINSYQVFDEGFEHILKKASKLEYINLEEAPRVIGDSFKSAISKEIKEIKIKFKGDYFFKLNNLEFTIYKKLQLMNAIIINKK